MSPFLKSFTLAIPILIGLGVGLIIQLPSEVERMAFSGQVTFIDWKSPNHGMPFIEIDRNNGTKVKFSDYRIILNSNQVKVGDSIIKLSGSKSCEINEKSVLCIK